mgnify:CR=1 FL=1
MGMAFLLSACGEDNAYTNALPKDAAAVFSFDLMEMAQKCDLNDQVKQSMGQMMKSSLKGSADALVDKLMENPEESGLRLTDRVYFFAASQMEMGGVLVRMADKGKLEDLMDSSRSVAAAAVACHECGHAIQHGHASGAEGV